MLGLDRLAAVLHGRAKPVLYTGTLIALAGTGTASAATIASTASAAPAPHAHIRTLAAADDRVRPGRARSHRDGRHGDTAREHRASLRRGHRSARHDQGHAAHGWGHRPHRSSHALHGWQHAPHGHRSARRVPDSDTWASVSRQLNWQTNPAAARHGQVLAADQLLPVATSGGQNWMPITPAQYANATAIVRRDLFMRMGLRSAVIAVATAMQESRLVNVNYGTGTSLGLFQQEPNMGWGTAAQVMDPAYAAGAFLGALHQYQSANPYWASQPLYEAAQGVQRSAFPYAYAQWESQAAQLVRSIAVHLS